MNISHRRNICLLVLSLATLFAQAQVTLDDKTSTKVDLGFGVEQSGFLTTAAVTTISGEELQQTSAISLADALYGKLLGLTALQVGGFAADENKGASLNIRGYQTFSEKGILVLVDGYERPIDRLTVEEVESVTVLKDAAAVAMLGHEAINGAILVKTKRGHVGKTQIKVGYSHKFTFDPQFAEMLDGHDYAAALNKAHTNDGLAPAYTQQELDLIKAGTDPHFYPNVNWQKETFKKVGSEDRANISVTGGTDKVQYYTMLDYTDSRGLLKGTQQQDYNSQLKYSKANIRSNVDFELSPSTKMSVNVLGMFMETNRPNDVDADGATWYVYRTPASAFPFKTSSGIWGGNEAYGDGNVAAKIQDSGFMKTHQRQLWANAKLTQDLGFWAKGLSVSVSAGYDNASITNEQRYKGHQYGYEYYTGTVGDKNNVQEVVMGNKEEKLNFNDWVDKQWRIAQFAVGVHYKTSFRDDDHFAASAVYNTKSEIRDNRSNTFYRANWLGNFHYDLKNKYVADLVLAANGSNRSYPAKWAFSPTLSLGYIYADNPDKLLTYGKLRASAGIQHTDYVPEAGIWLSQWSNSNGQFFYGQGFGNSWGSFITAFPTTNFSQEKATKVNLGTDLRLWNSLDITADVYYQKRSHILQNAREMNSWVVGIQSAYEDVGEVSSYGFELGARFARKIGKDLYVNASGMLTWNRNEIDYAIENPAYPNLSQIGKRVNEAWGLEAIGFYKDQDDINNSIRQEFSQVRPGDVKYKDQNGDGVINEFDRVALGSATDIPELNYAFGVGLEYKGLGFNALFQGTGNYMKNFRSVDGVWGVISDNRNLSKAYYQNSWDVAGQSALYPRLSSQSVPNNEQASTIWLQKVNFLKLRNCELYYKLPQKTVQRLRMSGIKVFLQGQNLLSFDNVDAMDAEVLSTAYPVLKSVNVGLALTF
ncbi:SusC/RagA family TonB-linked outer membrane protein [Bacteroides sp. 51]|uniref:SusC/RagA family TonB-linked outer membrane protein n=1 Tax=Bacteroides sp. 51 TaxID=2302938 RepID=UPI0013D366AC|nr:SusC/RagA family TonB-linked outer membrane protein [Bacteroides sp. 51]NDV82551.1 SusC/RagA family TonB-linked outer membrane protein [Bacteroides sp. 51]